MNSQIPVAFVNCALNSCLHKTNEHPLYIVESATKCVCKSSVLGDSFNFIVKNTSLKDVYFLAIDKCVFTTSAHKKCDFAIFDNKTFCFVEIKDTLSRSNIHKKKSISQLETTIIKFKAQIDFTGYDIEAIISWRYRPVRPVASTLMQTAKAYFILNLNAKLLEGNEKEFV